MSTSAWPKLQDVTAGFVCMRLHGDKELSSGYTHAALDDWARRIRCWLRGRRPRDELHRVSDEKPPRKSRDVYCCFDNDAKVRAPFDARKLRGDSDGGRAKPCRRDRCATHA